MEKKSDAEKAYWKEEEKRMKAILRTQRAAYTHDCFKGKLPDACYNLADMWSSDREYKKAYEMYQKMCLEQKHGHSCFKYGSIRRRGAHGIEIDENAAIEALKFACDENTNPQACYEHALAAAMGSDDKYAPDEKEAFGSLLKACGLGHAVSCLAVARYYHSGTGGAPSVDKPRAVEFARQACRALNWEGCHMVWKMYEKGDGIEQNGDVARRYRILTKGLREQMGL